MAQDDNKTAAELAIDLKKSFESATDEVKAIAEDALGKVKAGEETTSKMKTDADEALMKLNGLTEEVKQMAQKMDRVAQPIVAGHMTLGEKFVDQDNVKKWLSSTPSSGRADMRVKATLTTVTTDTPGSVGQGVDRQRLPGIIASPERRMTVRGLLSQGQMSQAAISWIQETGFTNNAGTVAEGAIKPSSDVQFTEKTSIAVIIAHWMKVSRQALDDVDQIRGHIDGRLVYDLALKEEAQLLFGDGAGSNLSGIATQATAYSAPFATTTETPIDQLRLAMLQAVMADYPANGHIMNPIDWARIELTKDANNAYIIGNPQSSATPTLWGLPVVATQSMLQDKFLTGAFSRGAQIWDSWDARIEVGYENDDFTRNLVTIRAEERLALAVYRPEAFIFGDFGFVV